MTCTKKELANYAGYTYRRLYDIDKALPPDEKLFFESEDGKYDLAIFIQRWVEYNVKLSSEGTEMSLEEAKTQHEIIKKRKTELEVQRMEGILVDANEIKHLWANIASTVTQNLLRLPSKIAPQVLAMDNNEVVVSIIDKEIRDVLTEISDTPLPQYEGTETDEEEA